MINISDKHLKILLSILSKYPYSFYAFGSRIKGNNQPFSDLDICYMDSIPVNILGEIRNDLEESSLPFRVDLVDFNSASTDFQSLIKKDLFKLN